MADQSATPSPPGRPAPSDLRERRVLVIGSGRSGLAAATVLADAGAQPVIVDEGEAPQQAPDLPAELSVIYGADPAGHLDGIDLVVPSPGVPEGADVIREAERRDIPVWSEPELGWRLAPRRLVGITGTNGKTTVTEMVFAMLTRAGMDAVACGNIGQPLSTAAAHAPADAVLVAELSSFQLRFCHELRPEVGVLLNLADDHLDWHGSMASYAAAKARLWRAQEPGDWAVANADDQRTLELLADVPAGRATFGGEGSPATGVFRRDARLISNGIGEDRLVIPIDQLVSDAPHHVANVAASATAALLVGAAPEAVAAAACDFRPGRHRLEVVSEADGITWVDDSKATNPHAAAAALRAYPSVVWIAGGLAKGVDLQVLATELAAVHHAIVIGAAADALADVCASVDVPVAHATTMEDAVEQAHAVARSGDTVLLAPACASFDMFDGYADRGERFAAAVRARLGRRQEVSGGSS